MRRRLAESYPLTHFYLLAFLIAWAGWWPLAAASRGFLPPLGPGGRALLVLPAIAPLLAAVIVRRRMSATEPRVSLLRPFLYRVGWWWYPLAALLPLVVLLGARLLTNLRHTPARPDLPRGSAAQVLLLLLLSVLANPWEEVGWRGFALPRLQARYGPLGASLIIGGLSGLWHLPLFYWPENPMAAYPFAPWLAGTIGTAFIATWLFNHTAGSLLVVAVFHIALNTFSLSLGIASFSVYAAANFLLVLMLYGFCAPRRRQSEPL